MSFSIQSLWKRAGKVEKAFAIALVFYLILIFVWPESLIEWLAGFSAFVLGTWLALRLLRMGLRKLTWRLRNRLIVAYLFIAVLPILLVLALVALGGYMLAGQVAAYLVRSELDRRIASLRAMADAFSASTAGIEQMGETQQLHFPGLILWCSRNGAVEVWPTTAEVNLPAGLPVNANGVAARGGRYYAWAAVGGGNRQFLALAPLSRRFLSRMLPGLGDVYFLERDFLEDQDSASQTDKEKVRVPRNEPRQNGVAVDGKAFKLVPAGADTSRVLLSPPINQFDLDVQWWSVIPSWDWTHPQTNESAVLLVHTRLSSIFAAILSQGTDPSQSGVLVIFYSVAIAFLIVGVAGLAVGVSMSRSITGAVHSLYEGTQRVMSGDFSHLIPVTGRDQLAELSGSFNTMTQNLEHLLAVAKEKERMQTEIEIARGVQDQLYPTAPPVFEDLRVLGVCDPARMVSGDYYDYQLVDGKLALAIADVAGKGISAALLMATIQAALRMELRAAADLATPSMNGLRFSTARMVSELNQQLYATTSPEKYATFFFAIYDPATRMFTYTNAGHLQPLLVRRGTATPLEVSGLMVGAFPFATYGESKIELESGDLLVCYTDGVTEPENEYGEMFGEQRLIDVVAKNADRDERTIIESVMECVREWTGAPELSDDMTVLLARKR